MADLRFARAELGKFCTRDPLSADVGAGRRDGRLRPPPAETAVVGPRRSGKTRSAAVCALWHCFRGADRHALVISAAEDRAKDVLALAAGIARDSRLLAGSVADVQTQRLTLSTGSAVRCMAAPDAGVRGNRAQLVIADEAAQIPDAILLGAARPIIASEPNGRLLLISSALRDSGAFSHLRTAPRLRWRTSSRCLAVVPVKLEDGTTRKATIVSGTIRNMDTQLGGLGLRLKADWAQRRSAGACYVRLPELMGDRVQQLFEVVGLKIWRKWHTPVHNASGARSARDRASRGLPRCELSAATRPTTFRRRQTR
jgi:terminase large subunit-like protein